MSIIFKIDRYPVKNNFILFKAGQCPQVAQLSTAPSIIGKAK